MVSFVRRFEWLKGVVRRDGRDDVVLVPLPISMTRLKS